MSKILFILTLFGFLALPQAGLASSHIPQCVQTCAQQGVTSQQCISCWATGGKTTTKIGGVEIKNPLEYDTIEDLIRAIIRFLQGIATIITAIVIVAAGYFFVFSQGDPAKVVQARNMVIYALVGLAIILVAQGIIAVIERVLKVKGG